MSARRRHGKLKSMTDEQRAKKQERNERRQRAAKLRIRKKEVPGSGA